MSKFAETISNEELALLPTAVFPGLIIVVDREEQIRNACEYLSEQPAVGFDTESRPSFRPGRVNKLALLQLSSDDMCFLFRLNSIRMGKTITHILENPNIIKVGAAIHDDISALQTLQGFRPRGFTDLQSIVGSYGIKELSLRKMSAITLGLRLSKAQRLSNWDAAELTPAQEQYAATDAWVSLEIYKKLRSTL